MFSIYEHAHSLDFVKVATSRKLVFANQLACEFFDIKFELRAMLTSTERAPFSPHALVVCDARRDFYLLVMGETTFERGKQ